MEHILKISYDLDFGGKGTVLKNTTNQLLRANKKAKVQEEFRKIGLIIDVPKQGSGTSNDGNTARRFFADTKTTSEITGVDHNLIFKFKIILQVLNCNRDINAVKFGQYANETAQLYNKLYIWRNMSPTVHKVLMHGEQIINHHILPIGDLSEEAQEKRNKDYRYYREHNTRKTSRQETNMDLLRMLLISSDPYITSLRSIYSKPFVELHSEAQKLLLEPTDEFITPNT